MLKIGTHNSASSEKPANVLSWLAIPFARTQSKAIKELLAAGCRLFDLRAKMYKGEYHNAHGIYTTKKTLIETLNELSECKDTIYVTLTYEGKFKNDEEKQLFLDFISNIQKDYPNFIYGDIVVKYTDNDIKVDWASILEEQEEFPKNIICKYKGLSGDNWLSYIPIPWFWNKIYFNKVEFSEEYFTYVDFL